MLYKSDKIDLIVSEISSGIRRGAGNSVIALYHLRNLAVNAPQGDADKPLSAIAEEYPDAFIKGLAFKLFGQTGNLLVNANYVIPPPSNLKDEDVNDEELTLQFFRYYFSLLPLYVEHLKVMGEWTIGEYEKLQKACFAEYYDLTKHLATGKSYDDTYGKPLYEVFYRVQTATKSWIRTDEKISKAIDTSWLKDQLQKSPLFQLSRLHQRFFTILQNDFLDYCASSFRDYLQRLGTFAYGVGMYSSQKEL